MSNLFSDNDKISDWTCPQCGKEFEITVGWLKNRPDSTFSCDCGYTENFKKEFIKFSRTDIGAKRAVKKLNKEIRRFLK